MFRVYMDVWVLFLIVLGSFVVGYFSYKKWGRR